MYLEKINSPEDIKKLTIDKLDILAGEIRELLSDLFLRQEDILPQIWVL